LINKIINKTVVSVVLFYLLTDLNRTQTLKYTKWNLGVFYIVFAFVDAGILKVKSAVS